MRKKKKQFKSTITNNHKITLKNDGVFLQGYVASSVIFRFYEGHYTCMLNKLE